jgi:uncharacterized YigZ family protein
LEGEMETSQRYPIPEDEHRVEEEIQRSRFITTLAPAGTVEAARAFIERIRQEFADATHNCWAFLVGPPGSSGHVGMSDDGEPHGTAGRPMLTVLQHGGVGDIAAVVTRYYGGTKLGKGGLARAYSGGVQLALATLETREKVAYRRRGLCVAYTHLSAAQQALRDHEAVIRNEDFAAEVTIALEVPVDREAGLVRTIEDLTHGGAEWRTDTQG